MLVTDLPEVQAVPGMKFLALVPAHLSIRLGVVDGVEMLALWDADADIHIVGPAAEWNARALKVALRNLSIVRKRKAH